MSIKGFFLFLTIIVSSLHAERAILTVDLKENRNIHIKNFRKCELIAASGSSQFSEEGLKYLINELNGRSITCVDLRQEPHGFKESSPISWKRGPNWVYAGALTEQIEQHQQNRLQEMLRRQKVKLSAKKPAVKMKIKRALTEKDLCESYNVKYLRIPVKDHHHPSDQEVNRFISYVRNLPEDAWVHFHCFAGIGRTSLFLIMYDAMKTAKTDTLALIVQRQMDLGSINLLYQPEDLSTWAKNESERKAFLYRFYDYCKNNSDNYKTAFSS